MAEAAEPIWTPSAERVAGAAITALIAQLGDRLPVRDYRGLHAFSVDQPALFWRALWDFLGVVGEPGDQVVDNPADVAGARWFGEARLNFAENHLRRRDAATAIVAYDEAGESARISWGNLFRDVSRVRAAMRTLGVAPGERVASCLPNTPEAVIACLAATSLGAIWAACAPEYAAPSIVDRFAQIQPRLLLTADAYRHGGKTFSLIENNSLIAAALPSVVAHVSVGEGAGAGRRRWESLLASEPDEDFERFPFDQPCFILYSSGTTGAPKAIIHGAGGSLLQSLKELALHCDCRPGEPVFWPTNPGWMVWNVMLSALAWGCPIVLYDGSPSFPSPARLFDVIEAEAVGVARIVPPLLDAMQAAGLRPRESHDLSSLRCLVSGSAPLLPHHYRFALEQVKADLHVTSPAGGTDIMGSLATGNPTAPVYAGEIQCAALGMAVEVWDEDCRALRGEAGELVCTRAFPSRPLGFWGDPGGERMRQIYFAKFPGVWRHGDWAEITSRGGVVIHGRADATLKIRGVRIGTAEIYGALSDCAQVAEAAAVLHGAGDRERLALFVVPAAGATLQPQDLEAIRRSIAERTTRRHVPDVVVPVPDLLRSLNGKPAEVAIRAAVNGRPLRGIAGLANPHVIPLFEQAGRELTKQS